MDPNGAANPEAGAGVDENLGVNLINAFEAVEDYRVVEILPVPVPPPADDHPGDGAQDPADYQPLAPDTPNNDDMNASVQGGNVSQESSSPTVADQLDPQSPPQTDSSPSSGASSSTNAPTPPSVELPRASDLLLAVSVGSEVNRNKIMEQAMAAMAELVKIALAEGEPLWERKGEMEILNGLQYLKEFSGVDSELLDEVMRMVEVGDQYGQYQNFELPLGNSEFRFDPLHIESSRAIGFVNMDPKSIAELLMNLNQWSRVFSHYVSKPAVLGVMSAEGDMSLDGMVQLMTAEFNLHTALVPTRRTNFARYCKQLDCGTWAVVDVSVDNVFPYPQLKYRKRPSGCLIQQAPNGSKIIWIEHVESDNKSVHPIFQQVVNSGFAFGASRWIASIIQDCQWQLTKMAPNTPTADGVVIPDEGKRSLLKLAERMTITYFKCVNNSTEYYWQNVPVNGAEDIRIRLGRPLNFPGKPTSTTVIFTSSIWLPAPPRRVFDFLRNENSRNKWDLLSTRRHIQELAYVSNGQDQGNRVSVLQVNYPRDKIEIMYVQESFWDAAGCSYVIYAPVEVVAMSVILNGGDADQLSILTSGFVIFPDNPALGEESGGSILTLGFHTVDGKAAGHQMPMESAVTIYRVICAAFAGISAAVVAP